VNAVDDEPDCEHEEDEPDCSYDSDKPREPFVHLGKTYYKDNDGFLYATADISDVPAVFVINSKGVVMPLF